MKKIIAVSAAVACCSLLAFSSVATAGGSKDLNAPKAGRTGPVPGASNISGWAVVDADGTLVSKSNAVSASKLGTGTYEVAFNSKLTHCAYSGMIATPEIGNPSTGFLEGSPRSGNIKAVFIETHDATGASADLPFHLVVTCA